MNKFFFLLVFPLVLTPQLYAWHSVLGFDTHEKIANDAVLLISSVTYPDVYRFIGKLKRGSDTESHNGYDATGVYFSNRNELNDGRSDIWWNNARNENYKQSQFSDAYFNIGRMLHSIQDQAVPAHGANIFHGIKLDEINAGIIDPFADNVETAADSHYVYPAVGVQGGYAYPYGYYQPLLDRTFAQADNSYTPSSTWRDTSGWPYWFTDNHDNWFEGDVSDGKGVYGGLIGEYGWPLDNYDWAISPNIVGAQLGDGISYTAGALIAASMKLPPLISTFSITSGDVNGPAGAQISFTVMENRLPDVKIDLYVQETSQPVITNGLIKQLPYNQSDNGREYYSYSPDTAAWTAKDLSLYPTLSSDLELLPQMAQFQLEWSGEVVGAPLTPREEPYTLAMRVTDHDGNTDKYSHQFIVRPDVTPPTVRWTTVDTQGVQVTREVTGANTLETAPWFHIGYSTETYISFQFQDAGTGVGNFSIYSPSAGEGPGAPLFSAAFRSGQSFLLSDFTLQNDAAGYLLAATDALGNATTVYFHLDRQHPEIQISTIVVHKIPGTYSMDVYGVATDAVAGFGVPVRLATTIWRPVYSPPSHSDYDPGQPWPPGPLTESFSFTNLLATPSPLTEGTMSHDLYVTDRSGWQAQTTLTASHWIASSLLPNMREPMEPSTPQPLILGNVTFQVAPVLPPPGCQFLDTPVGMRSKLIVEPRTPDPQEIANLNNWLSLFSNIYMQEDYAPVAAPYTLFDTSAPGIFTNDFDMVLPRFVKISTMPYGNTNSVRVQCPYDSDGDGVMDGTSVSTMAPGTLTYDSGGEATVKGFSLGAPLDTGYAELVPSGLNVRIVSESLEIIFSEVLEGGKIFVKRATSYPEIPGYRIDKDNAWDLEITANYSDLNIKACMNTGTLAESQISNAELYHYNSGSGAWEKVTTGRENGCVKGFSQTASPFVVMVPVYDVTAPETGIGFKQGEQRVVEGNLYLSTNTYVNYYASDLTMRGDISGVATMYSLIDIAPAPECLAVQFDPAASKGTCANPFYTGPFKLAEGIHSLHYFSSDNSFNTESPRTERVYADGTAPETQMTAAGIILALGTTTAYITDIDSVSIAAADPVSNGVASGLKRLHYLVDVLPQMCADVPEDAGAPRGTCANPAYAGPFSLPVGTHTVSYSAVDNVGNQAEAKTAYITVASPDTIPPVTRFGVIGSSAVVDGKLYVSAASRVSLSAYDPAPTDSSGLVAYWNFDETGGAIAHDAVGTNNATLVNGPVPNPAGQVGGALQFDGVDDYLNAGNSLDLSAGNVTLAGWIYPTGLYGSGLAGDKTIISAFDSAYNKGYILVIRNGFLAYYSDSIGLGGAVALNQWQHVAVTVTGSAGGMSDYVLYINGEITGFGSKPSFQAVQPTAIGAYQPQTVGVSYFKGSMDELAIYNRVLPANEVAALYNKGLSGIGVNVAGSASGLAFTEYSVDAAPFQVYSAPFGLTEGVRSVDYRSRDVAGNLEVLKSAAVYVDGTNPGVDFVVNNSVVENGGTAQITDRDPVALAGVDPVVNGVASGLKSVNYTLDAEFTAGNTRTYAGPFMLYMGTHTIYYSAMDNVGNQAEVKTAYLVVTSSDTTPPVTEFGVIGSSAVVDGKLYVNARSSVSLSAYDPAPAESPGLIAYWNFDETAGTIAHDAVGTNNATLVNGPVPDPAGQVGGALQFDGVDDYLNAGNSLDLSAGNVTLAGWIYPTGLYGSGLAGDKTIISAFDSAYNKGYILVIRNGYLAYYSDSIGLGGAVALNQWQHVAVTVTGSAGGMSDYVLYINGEITGFGSKPSFQAVQPTAIGAYQPQTVGVSYFKGSMDELAIYNRVLPVNEVTALYNKGLAGKTVNAADSPPSGVALTEYSIDSAPFQIYSAPFVLSEGIRSIDYRSRDVAGNLEAVKSAVVYVDGTAPGVDFVVASSVTADGGTAYIMEQDSVTLAAADPEVNGAASGLARVLYSIDSPFSLESALQYASPFGLSPGTHTVYCTALDKVLNQAPVKTVQVEVRDIIPPSPVGSLAASDDPATGEVTLTWTAPGDDGAAGTASSYDIRYAPSEISDGAAFGQATVIPNALAPKAAGEPETFTVRDLAGGSYYFAIVATDESGNGSPAAGTGPVTVPYVAAGGQPGGAPPELIFAAAVPVSAVSVDTVAASTTVVIALGLADTQGLLRASGMYEIGPEGAYDPPAVLTFYYSTATLAGLGIPESEIAVYEYFSATGWVKLAGQILDTTAKKITVPVSNIASLFAIFRAPTEPVAAVKLELEPDTLNLNSNGQYVTAILKTAGSNAACFSRTGVNISAINGIALTAPVYEAASNGNSDEDHGHGAPKAKDKDKGKGDNDDKGKNNGNGGGPGQCGAMTVKFDRAAVIAVLPVNATVKVTVSGVFADGGSFSADDTIRTIKPRLTSRRDGGRFEHDKRACADAPPLALKADDDLYVVSVESDLKEREAKKENAAKAKGIKRRGLAYEFGPDGAVFDKPVTISLPYDADEKSPEKLVVAYWNETAGAWEPLSSRYDAQARVVKAEVGHFSQYQLVMAAPASGDTGPSASGDNSGAAVLAVSGADPTFRLGEVYVFPNPAKGGAKPVFHIETGIADSVEITVYTVSGRTAHQHTITSAPEAMDDGNGLAYAYEYAWDGHIPSGVYYYSIKAEKAGRVLKKAGKFAVVR